MEFTTDQILALGRAGYCIDVEAGHFYKRGIENWDIIFISMVEGPMVKVKYRQFEVYLEPEMLNEFLLHVRIVAYCNI